MGSTVHGVLDFASEQEAIDAALAAGEEFHGKGYRVGPPWYRPVPIHGTSPLEYRYEGRVWYGDGPDALWNRFYSHLYEFEDAAVLEAEYFQEELAAAGYEIYETELHTLTFDARPYIQAQFMFSMPGAEVPRQKRVLWPWLLTGGLFLGVTVLAIAGDRMR